MYSICNAMPYMFVFVKTILKWSKLLFSKHLCHQKELIILAINHSISTTQTSDIVHGIFSKVMKSAVLYQI